MPTVRVLAGTGRAPTALSAYDAALAAANVHDYNLVAVSSVLPPDAEVEVVERAPDLGPVGGRLTVVEAAATVAGTGPVSAALGWTRAESGADTEGSAAAADGAGVVYEAADATGPEPVEAEVRAGLAAAREIRDWTAATEETVVATVPEDGPVEVSVGDVGEEHETPKGENAADRHTAAVALAVYGSAKPVD